MPELPEVETIASGLRPQLTGRRIVSVQVRNASTIQGHADGFARVVAGRVIAGVGRRGKLLLLELAPPDVVPDVLPDVLPNVPPDVLPATLPIILPEALPNAPREALQGTLPVGVHDAGAPHLLGVHLKMTGRLFVHGPGIVPNVHTRVVFALDDGNRLFFDDARKFGYVRALSRAELGAWDFWRTLGPEPLEISAEGFVNLFRGRRGRIKALLLDQRVIAGIGNIYADESLFRAGIRPDAPADALTPRRLAALHGHVVAVLREAIAECGSSIRDYRDAHGDAGAFQNRFRVYGRTGMACVACGAALTTARVAGRTTVYCETCQKP